MLNNEPRTHDAPIGLEIASSSSRTTSSTPCRRRTGSDGTCSTTKARETPAAATAADGGGRWRLPPFTAAGCGSVGSSLLYGALAIGAAGGPLHLVDPDPFTERNRLRYPILRENLDGTTKTEWLADLCQAAGIAANEYPCDLKGYTKSFDRPPAIDLVVVSTDTLAGRRDATDLLAATTLNLGVAGLQLHPSRHAFGADGSAYCQYVDIAPPLSGAEVVADNADEGFLG